MDIKDFIYENAPMEEYSIRGKNVLVSRQDLRFREPLPPNMKMEAMYALVKHASEQGYKKVAMFAKKQHGTPYVTGLPIFAQMFNMETLITIPAGKNFEFENWHYEAQKQNSQIIKLHPNMVSINLNQTKKIAEENNAFFIPMGFDHHLGVESHVNSFQFDRSIGTIVVATMTGIVLAGLLKSIDKNIYHVENVYGISCGRPIKNVESSISKYIGSLPANLKIIEMPRNMEINQVPSIFPFQTHPDYEAKAWIWMYANADNLPEPICFINVGR